VNKRLEKFDKRRIVFFSFNLSRLFSIKKKLFNFGYKIAVMDDYFINVSFTKTDQTLKKVLFYQGTDYIYFQADQSRNRIDVSIVISENDRSEFCVEHIFLKKIK